MIEIVVTSRGADRFEARLGERVILKSSRQPLLDAARVLLREGVPPDTRIGMRHAGTPHTALSATVGKAAKLTVKERDSGNGPVFASWEPYPSAPVPPSMRLNAELVPNTAPTQNKRTSEQVTR